jgi:hypothetical protein
MELTQIIILTIIGLFSLAFAIQILIGTWKMIYKSAPVVVPLLVLIGILFLTIELGYYKPEMDVKDADHIESIENKSESSKHRK